MIIDNDGVINDDQLIDLYNYFMPNYKKSKDLFSWVNNVVSKEETRYYLGKVFVKKGVMMATDGHRLHMAPTELEDGFYDPAGIKIEFDGKFPDVKRVIPKSKGSKRATWKRSEAEVVNVDGYGGKPCQCYKLPHGNGINKKYFDEAVYGYDKVKYEYNTKTDPIKLIFPDGKKAILMPMRIDNE